MNQGQALVISVRRELAAAGDPGRATHQQAYMKSAMPFRGISSPELRALLRPILASHALADRGEWEASALDLWDGATHREERYVALALLRHRHYRAWVDLDLLPLLRHLVETGAWWDLVDEIASHLVGHVLATQRREASVFVRAWAVDDDLWIRRTAVLSQLGHKDQTDTGLLADVLIANLADSLHGSQFFIRKAVGWALRDYARIDPAWVRAFVTEHEQGLSPLSRREALKHVAQTGTSSTAPTA